MNREEEILRLTRQTEGKLLMTLSDLVSMYEHTDPCVRAVQERFRAIDADSRREKTALYQGALVELAGVIDQVRVEQTGEQRIPPKLIVLSYLAQTYARRAGLNS